MRKKLLARLIRKYDEKLFKAFSALNAILGFPKKRKTFDASHLKAFNVI